MSSQLETLVATAQQSGASDLHLEPGLPAAVRVRGALRTLGEPLPSKTLHEIAHDLVGPQWPRFLKQRSFDMSRTLSGVRCRINLLQTSRGVGMAVRLLASFQATLETLNLHPDLKRLIAPQNGLALVSGPTGCGKSSTLAALIQEINLTEPRHIITVESPIEYTLRPRRAFIRQREVGRDTPSFEQALLDALREDPDVLMVGEMRDPETMRLTLNAAETGHLVLATVHSSSCAEALQRIVSAFPSDIQGNVSSQLADCLVAVVAQRLRYRTDLNIRVPECEILFPSTAVKAFIRNRDFFKIAQVMETGVEHGMWTFERYQKWLTKRTRWHVPGQGDEPPDEETAEPVRGQDLPPLPAAAAHPAPPPGAVTKPREATAAGPIEIEPVEGGLKELLKKLE
jgi:twitching motility protein PilT